MNAITNDELNALLLEYAEAKRMQAQAQATVDLLKKQIAKLLDDMIAGKK